MASVIYVVHFQRPIGNGGNSGKNRARHYVGVAPDGDVEARMARHRAGQGARILAFCNAAGIAYDVVATLPGGRTEERRLKTAGHIGERWCPVCRAASEHPAGRAVTEGVVV